LSSASEANVGAGGAEPVLRTLRMNRNLYLLDLILIEVF
jgi:hypothetical protein